MGLFFALGFRCISFFGCCSKRKCSRADAYLDHKSYRHGFGKSVLRAGLRRLRSLPLRSKAPLWFLVILFAHGGCDAFARCRCALRRRLSLERSFCVHCHFALRLCHGFFKSVLRTGLWRLRSLPLRSR